MTNRIDLSKDSISLHRDATDANVVRDWTGAAPKASKPAFRETAPKPRKRNFWDWLNTPLWS